MNKKEEKNFCKAALACKAQFWFLQEVVHEHERAFLSAKFDVIQVNSNYIPG
jgi:hypothetical protein